MKCHPCRGSLPNRALGRGFSLIEIVIVLFLTSVIMFAVAQLLARSFQTLRFLQEKSQTLESASLGCERLASEMREMITQLPQPDGVRFLKVRPQAPVAVANPFGDLTVMADNWERSYASDYAGVNQLVEVLYRVNPAEQLERTVEGQTTLVATNVNDFNVTPVSGAVGAFVINLSLREERRVVTFTTAVTCPALEQDWTP